MTIAEVLLVSGEHFKLSFRRPKCVCDAIRTVIISLSVYWKLNFGRVVLLLPFSYIVAEIVLIFKIQKMLHAVSL
jgi:hypothetical protein